MSWEGDVEMSFAGQVCNMWTRLTWLSSGSSYSIWC